MSEESDNEQQSEPEEFADPLAALGRAANRSARKDELTSMALQAFRRTRWIVIVWIAALTLGLSLVGYWVHDINTRSAHNANVLVCFAASEQDVSRDIHTLIHSHAKAPAEEYAIPSDCATIQ